MPQEIEIKLALDPADRPRLLAHPWLASAPVRTERLRNTYVDTPGLALLAQRVAVRERRIGRRTLLTVKTAGATVGGLSRRGEWEAPRRPGPWDFARFVDQPALAAELDGLAWQLVPVFHTDFVRRRWLLAHGGAHIEVALDQGEIRTGSGTTGRREPILELELELLDGPVDALLDLAHTLVLGPTGWAADALRLRPATRSKAERGYALFLGQSVMPVKAATPPLAPAMHPVAAFQTAALACLTHLQANQEPAIWAGPPAPLPDPEFVHQARVALRRLRTLLRLFREALDPDWVVYWTSQWRDVAQVLGEARNWDVFETELLPTLWPPDAPAAAGLTWVQVQRAQAVQTASAMLASPAHALRVLAFTRALLRLRSARRQRIGDLGEWARQVLRQGHADLRRHARHAAQLGPEGRHELRLALKRLRYTQECLASLLPERQLSRSTARLAEAQGVLGWLNDLSTAQALLARAPDGLEADGIAVLRAALQQRLEQALAGLPEVVRTLERAHLS